MSTKVALAQADLDAAKKEEAAAERERDLKTLREAFKELRELEKRYERMESAILRADGKRSIMQAELGRLNNELTAHLSDRPEYADLLPDDEDTISWHHEREQIISERDAAAARLRAGVPGPDRMEALKLADQIAGLKRVTRNLAAKLRGELAGKWPEGGISLVE